MNKVQTKEALFRDRAPEQERRQLERDFVLMKDYLLMCFQKEDWHGVMDASADIREIVAKLSVLNRHSVLGWTDDQSRTVNLGEAK
ncbi:hypothetical protein [Stenotrophobium rhamnosiphilum]|nr:hypothetical protein [Stenotrophobium rhamnosiphilum]